MKTSFTLIATFLFASLSFAQILQVSTDTGLITYSEVLTFDGKTADLLFDKSKSWFVEYFKDAKNVIVGENRPDIIKGVYISKYRGGMGIQTPYKNILTVKAKNGAIKVIVDNIWTAPEVIDPEGVHYPFVGGKALETMVIEKDGKMKSGSTYDKFYRDIETKSHEMTLNLKAYIEKKSDW